MFRQRVGEGSQILIEIIGITPTRIKYLKVLIKKIKYSKAIIKNQLGSNYRLQAYNCVLY